MSTCISEVKGVGPKSHKLLNQLGIYTVSDILAYYPRKYDVFEPLVPIEAVEEGEIVAIKGNVASAVSLTHGRNLPVVSLSLRDRTGDIRLVWFRMAYLKKVIKPGQTLLVRGRVSLKNHQYVLEQPEIYSDVESYLEKVGTLVPVYGVKKGISNHFIGKTIAQCIQNYRDEIQEQLPKEVLQRYQLCNYEEAILGVHFPVTKEEFAHARKRLVFEEFLQFLLELRSLGEPSAAQENECLVKEFALAEKTKNTLPYALTGAQEKVWTQIKEDMSNPEKIMNRLVQGDVGSGKTVVALLALLGVVEAGYQGALMAPTEVLANQHYQEFKEMFETQGIDKRVELLTGSMTAKEKRESYARIKSGEVDLVIGTHALFQNKVEYHKLGLVITDEQHRFGVKQRESLKEKGLKPHVLVMSATPIPRTLAIILYGDLDISVIDELPANRLPIKNCVVDTNYRNTAYEFMKNQVKEGRQCYVVCPMVEESEEMDGENVLDYAEKLRQIFGEDIVVAHLHGRMKQKEKDEIMSRFASKEAHVLVSTTVIEVGINVPNATVMLIENAERFGLSGLHQLRGRVGRGKHQSYCIFMSTSKSKETKKRLEILGRSNDGFEIANEDLKLRGPGDLFGIRQSGELNFKMADIIQDAIVLQQVNECLASLSEKQCDDIVKRRHFQGDVII